MDRETLTTLFAFFNEVGIINQLSRAVLEEKLPDGIIQPHFSVLNHLIRVRDGQTPAKLASAFQVPKTSMSHTLAGLAKHGFIEMRPNPQDGRGKCVWITPAGRALREGAIEGMAPEIAALAQVINPKKIEAALPLLTEIRVYMDQARDPKTPD